MTRQEIKTRETTRQGINYLAAQDIVRVEAIDHGNDVTSTTSKLTILGFQLGVLLLGFVAKGVTLTFFSS